MKYRALTFVMAISAGCATEPASDELNVELGQQHVSVSRGDDSASLTWTDAEATLVADGQRATVLRADSSGTWAPVATADSFAKAARLVMDADSVLVRDGVELPWRTLASGSGIADCTTVSTWVRGGSGSCTDCRAVAWNEAGGPQGDHTGGSCSQGSLWTTCTHTWCSDGFQTESSYEQ